MKKNFKTATPKEQSVSVNTNKRHDYSHTKFLTTDVGRFQPVGFWELEPGEEIDFENTFFNLESMPMLLDSKQSWEISLQFFACRKNVLWDGYRNMKYPNYKQIQRSAVSQSLTPFFKIKDLARPQLIDCVRFENGQFVPRSFLFETSKGWSNYENSSLNDIDNNDVSIGRSVIEDEFGSLSNQNKHFSGVLKMCQNRSAQNPFNTFRIGKGSIFDCLDGYLCKNELDFSLESLYSKTGTNYFDKVFTRWDESSSYTLDNLDMLDLSSMNLVNFVKCNINIQLQEEIRQYSGIDVDYLYCLCYVTKDASNNYLCIPISFYVYSSDYHFDLTDSPFQSSLENAYQKGYLVRKEVGQFINVNRAISMKNLHATGDFDDILDMSFYDYIMRYRDHTNHFTLSGFDSRSWGYLTPHRNAGETSFNLYFTDFPVAISQDVTTCNSSDCVAFGYPNLLWNSKFASKDIAFSESDTLNLIDATPLRMYHYIVNNFRKDLNYGEDFDFRGNGLFKKDGEEIANLKDFISYYSNLPSWIDESISNAQMYVRPNFGYFESSDSTYKNWFIGSWFFPSYVAREEDIFTYIKLECDPVALANVPVQFASVDEHPASAAMGSGELFANSSATPSVSVTAVSEPSTFYTSSGKLLMHDLSFNLESERIIRRQTSIMYNIMNGGRHDWELHYAMTGCYPTDAFIELPSYLGGVTKSFSALPLMNESQTDANPLGFTQGVVSQSFKCGHVGLRAEEQTLVMAFITIRPHNIYISDGILPTVQRIGYEEQFAPEFADLSEEEVKGRVLNWQPFSLTDGLNSITENNNDKPIGYLPRNTFLKGALNRVCGDYRDTLHLFLNSFKHRAVEGAVLDIDFMTCKPHDYDDIFVFNDGSDRWKLEIGFDMSVSRAISTNPQIKL